MLLMSFAVLKTLTPKRQYYTGSKVQQNLTTHLQVHNPNPHRPLLPSSLSQSAPRSSSVGPCEQLGHRTLWCLPAQVPVTPALPRFPQSHWSWLLAPAVAACAHSRPPAQSLSRPIYLTQTGDSRPSPAYLGSAWFSLGFRNSPVPLHPGSCNGVWVCVCVCVSSVKETWPQQTGVRIIGLIVQSQK